MHAQTKPEEFEEFARLDGAILELLVGPNEQRPWSETEVARDINTPGNVSDGLSRLHKAGLVHRWEGLASATQSAVRFYNLTQSDDPHTEAERRMELSILELLLTPSSRSKVPLSEKEIRSELGVPKSKYLELTDALCRLDGAGLVRRAGKLIFASEAAARFDYISNI
ncbi:MAG: hypothetical protein WA484_04745 [Solirubrobacteraceae bacterium]